MQAIVFMTPHLNNNQMDYDASTYLDHISSFIHSFVRSLTHSLTRSLTHSFIQQNLNIRQLLWMSYVITSDGLIFIICLNSY